MLLLISHHPVFYHWKTLPACITLRCFEKPLKNKVNVKMFIKTFYMNLFVWLSILFCQKKEKMLCYSEEKIRTIIIVCDFNPIRLTCVVHMRTYFSAMSMLTYLIDIACWMEWHSRFLFSLHCKLKIMFYHTMLWSLFIKKIIWLRIQGGSVTKLVTRRVVQSIEILFKLSLS